MQLHGGSLSHDEKYSMISHKSGHSYFAAISDHHHDELNTVLDKFGRMLSLVTAWIVSFQAIVKIFHHDRFFDEVCFNMNHH